MDIQNLFSHYLSLSVFVSILLIFPCFVVISFGLYYLYNSHFYCFGLCMKMMQWEIEAICNLYELSGGSLQCCAPRCIFSSRVVHIKHHSVFTCIDVCNLSVSILCKVRFTERNLKTQLCKLLTNYGFADAI